MLPQWHSMEKKGSEDLPPYSAIAMAQCMPPRKDAIEAPYPSCRRAAFATRSAGRKGRLCAMGGASAKNGMAPADTNALSLATGEYAL